MTPSRPYLVRALYDWIVDNNLTPHIVVDTRQAGVEVPAGLAEDGRIVLNIGPRAVQALNLGNEKITFSARFGGVPTDVRVPENAVMGIYARENGRGMLFPEHDPVDPSPPTDPTHTPPERPRLKVVK